MLLGQFEQYLYIHTCETETFEQYLATVILDKVMHEDAAFLSTKEAFESIDKFGALPHMYVIAQNMRLACQDCQYNDLGVTAGRIAVMREKTLNVELPDKTTELRPAFAQVAVFYISDAAKENVLKIQGRLQPQNIATDDEESSYDVLVVLTQSVQSPLGHFAANV